MDSHEVSLQNGSANSHIHCHCRGDGIMSVKGVDRGPSGSLANVLPRYIHKGGQYGGLHGVSLDSREQRNVRESIAVHNAMEDPFRDAL